MKKCSTCGEFKALTEFHKNKVCLDGHQRYCKACHSEINKNHYLNNKKDYVSRAKAQRKSKTLWWRNYKKEISCSLCEESRWWCIDFHHLDPNTKEYGISQMVTDSKSRKSILKEIEKCIPVCRNCHADIHHKESMSVAQLAEQ